MTYEKLYQLIGNTVCDNITNLVDGVRYNKNDFSNKIAKTIVDKVKEEERDASTYTFIILGAFESELLKETISGDSLEISEFNYTVYSDDEIVFSIPQENVVYVKRG